MRKSTGEGITYSVLEKGNRMLFMPHSPGVYVALMLADITGAEDSKDKDKSGDKDKDKDKDKKQMTGKKATANVTKKKMNNYVFLDIQSLAKNLQTILM